jgi:hypothetical protein
MRASCEPTFSYLLGPEKGFGGAGAQPTVAGLVGWRSVSGGKGADLDEVVGEDPVSAPGPGTPTARRRLSGRQAALALMSRYPWAVYP